METPKDAPQTDDISLKELGKSQETSETSHEVVLPKTNSGWRFWLVATIMLITGTSNSMLLKGSNRELAARFEGGPPEYFVAPFFQTWFMFIGEFVCLIVYYVDKYITERQGKKPTFDMTTNAKSFNKPYCPFYWWFIPCACDYVGTTLHNYAFVFIDASIGQLLFNFMVVVTAAIYLLYLREALRWCQYYGVALCSVGMILTGVSAFQNPGGKTAYGDSMIWLGVVMALVSTGMNGFQFVFEEGLFRKYHCSPMRAVGLEGFCGLLISAVVLPILEVTGVEKTSESFYQMNQNGVIMATNVSFIFSIIFFNGASLSITKLSSCIMRALLSAGRSVSVWVFDVLIFQWSKFNVVTLLGLLVIVCSIVMYSNGFACPCLPKWNAHLNTPLVYLCLNNPDTPEELKAPNGVVHDELDGVKA